jgi:hypothetical protein
MWGSSDQPRLTEPNQGGSGLSDIGKCETFLPDIVQFAVLSIPYRGYCSCLGLHMKVEKVRCFLWWQGVETHAGGISAGGRTIRHCAAPLQNKRSA